MTVTGRVHGGVVRTAAAVTASLTGGFAFGLGASLVVAPILYRRAFAKRCNLVNTRAGQPTAPRWGSSREAAS